MSNKKRILALSVAAALTTTALAGPIVSAQDDDSDVKIGFVTHVLGNPFIQQIIDGAEFAAAAPVVPRDRFRTSKSPVFWKAPTASISVLLGRLGPRGPREVSAS